MLDVPPVPTSLDPSCPYEALADEGVGKHSTRNATHTTTLLNTGNLQSIPRDRIGEGDAAPNATTTREPGWSL